MTRDHPPASLAAAWALIMWLLLTLWREVLPACSHDPRNAARLCAATRLLAVAAWRLARNPKDVAPLRAAALAVRDVLLDVFGKDAVAALPPLPAPGGRASEPRPARFATGATTPPPRARDGP